MRPLFPVFFALVTGSLPAQQHISLYEGMPPNSKTVAGLRDSIEFFIHGQDTIEWMSVVASPDLTIYLPEKKKAGGAAAIREYSNELHVRPDTPPTFITSAVDDDVVKVQNSLVFIAALQQNKVPVGSFFYANGGHGYGMDNPTSEVEWMDTCLAWLQERGLLD